MKHVFTLLLLLLGTCLTGAAQSSWPRTYSIRADTSFVVDTAHFQVLEDREGRFNLADVQRSNDFRPGPNFDRHRHSHVYWIRFRLKNDQPQTARLYLCDFSSSLMDMYWLDSTKRWQHQRTGLFLPLSQITSTHNGTKERNRMYFQLQAGQETTLYQRAENMYWQPPLTYITPQIQTEQGFVQATYTYFHVNNRWKAIFFDGIMIGILLLAACYNLVIFFLVRDWVYLYFSICLIFFTLDRNRFRLQRTFFEEHAYVFELTANFFFIIFFVFFVQTIRKFIQPDRSLFRLNRAISVLLVLTIILNGIQLLAFTFPVLPIDELGLLLEIMIRLIYVLCLIMAIVTYRKGSDNARLTLIATTPLFIFWLFTLSTRFLGIYFNLTLPFSFRQNVDYAESFCFAWMIIVFSVALVNRYNLARQQVARQALEREQLEKEREIERNRLIETQNERLEKEVQERTAELQQSLHDLKAAQNQLIQKEKLASLGELTAGIAHEIQNPLNFVNNFSEVSTELVDELKEGPFQQLPDAEKDYAKEILGDLTQNLQKITHHGKRAGSIVRGMLEHSRTSTGEKLPTDLNALCDEYLRLAYQGLRAKDQRFNAEIRTDFLAELPSVSVVAQDLGRVLLNLYNNAFYAVQQRTKQAEPGYTPTVWVSTRQELGRVVVCVRDNGPGIPEAIREKIFQPFFTTKPTGEGTGLGLSLSYDIVTKGHGGAMEVESVMEEGTTFAVVIPA